MHDRFQGRTPFQQMDDLRACHGWANSTWCRSASTNSAATGGGRVASKTGHADLPLPQHPNSGPLGPLSFFSRLPRWSRRALRQPRMRRRAARGRRRLLPCGQHHLGPFLARPHGGASRRTRGTAPPARHSWTRSAPAQRPLPTCNSGSRRCPLQIEHTIAPRPDAAKGDFRLGFQATSKLRIGLQDSAKSASAWRARRLRRPTVFPR